MTKDPFIFNPDDWYTPNTFNTNFREPPQRSGVYLLVKPDFSDRNFYTYEIMYVGSSKNLLSRFSRHEVLRSLKITFGYIQFYFKEFENYLEVEKNLIKKIQPEYNTQWR